MKKNLPYTLVGYIIKKVELPQRGIRIFFIIKLALSLRLCNCTCAEPSARRDALAQNRHCNGSIEDNLNTPDWISMAPDRRRSKGREGKKDEGRL